jgi:hypothetical protein
MHTTVCNIHNYIYQNLEDKLRFRLHVICDYMWLLHNSWNLGYRISVSKLSTKGDFGTKCVFYSSTISPDPSWTVWQIGFHCMPCRRAQQCSIRKVKVRVKVLLFLDLGTSQGVGGQHHDSAALTPENTQYLLYRRLGGPQGRSGCVRKILPPPGFDPRTVQPVASRYVDWVFLALHQEGEDLNLQQNDCHIQ